MHANTFCLAVAAMRGIKREAIRDEDSDGQAEARIEALFFRTTRRAGEASSPTYEGAPTALVESGALSSAARSSQRATHWRPLQSRRTNTPMQPLWAWPLLDRTRHRCRRTRISRTPITSTLWSPLTSAVLHVRDTEVPKPVVLQVEYQTMLDITAQLVNLLRGTDVSASRLFHGSLPL